MNGLKEVLGIWASDNEGSKFWMQVITELKNRGVQDIFIACVDGLKGFPEAIEAMIVQQITQNKVKVLPLLYKDCEIPMFLSDKHYVDFRDPFKYETEFQKLLDRIKH